MAKKQATITWKDFTKRFNRNVSIAALVAETIGVFALTSIVLSTNGDSFFTGVSLIALSAAFIGVSGAHLNPAITFGLWTSRNLPGICVPFFWIAQFVGAIAAIATQHLFSGQSYSISLNSFWSLDPKIFFAEMLGVLVFAFAYSAVTRKQEVGEISKAVGIGLGLVVGMVMATGLLSAAVSTASSATDEKASESRITKVGGVALNPAVAFALTEKSSSSVLSASDGESEKTTPVSRLTLETILGPLVGAALAFNLHRVLADRKK